MISKNFFPHFLFFLLKFVSNKFFTNFSTIFFFGKTFLIKFLHKESITKVFDIYWPYIRSDLLNFNFSHGFTYIKVSIKRKQSSKKRKILYNKFTLILLKLPITCVYFLFSKKEFSEFHAYTNVYNVSNPK